ncbi:uncharacterized protein EDB93DRAFT_161419 [Suillus bovinus]|uniref:uncharacterized protein n=1 Tax=Suillus bovinus TaxID=48563 RepID=UPI001B87F23B|nr:uncharacterized protein EDB93DRAFT_161419 [Suillus bovinus]KAG2154438.1 hypothetical protein EDB93DRAFT_161419 [Suillus bovinus]
MAPPKLGIRSRALMTINTDSCLNIICPNRHGSMQPMANIPPLAWDPPSLEVLLLTRVGTPHKRLPGKRLIYIHMDTSRELTSFRATLLHYYQTFKCATQWPFGRRQSRGHRLRGQPVHTILFTFQIISEVGTSITELFCFEMRVRQIAGHQHQMQWKQILCSTGNDLAISTMSVLLTGNHNHAIISSISLISTRSNCTKPN